MKDYYLVGCGNVEMDGLTVRVSKYGYTDLPHMMREFKRYHSMNIREAREMAYW